MPSSIYTIATPRINPIAGSYRYQVEVTLGCETPNVDIYYTIDGSTPDETDSLYEDGTPIVVSSTTTIKAIGILSGWTNSGVASSIFTISGLTHQYNMNLRPSGTGAPFSMKLSDYGIFIPTVSGDDGYKIDQEHIFNNSIGSIFFGDDGINKSDLFVRFPDITIPNSKHIESAAIKFVSSYNVPDVTCNVNCYFNDEDDAVAPTSWTEYEGKALTAAVAWNGVVAQVIDQVIYSPDLSSILQTVIDRDGWVSGQSVMVMIKNNSSSSGAFRGFRSIDYLSGIDKPQLIVSY